jgi:hypothetical protein
MGIVGIHPGSFRKSGKCRAYGIRNLEEHREDGILGRVGEILRLAMLAQDDYPHRIVDLEECTEDGRLRKGIGIARGPLPHFFVSVASKRLSHSVSLLFATLAGRHISVATRGLGGIVGQGKLNMESAESRETRRSGI